MAAWLVTTLGPDVNLENVPLMDCWRVYAMRHGMTRDTGYRFMSRGQGKA